MSESSDDEKQLPQALAPKHDFNVLQGSVTGHEFDTLKKDSNPLNDLNAQNAIVEQPIKEEVKKKKLVKKSRRVKKVKKVKKPIVIQ